MEFDSLGRKMQVIGGRRGLITQKKKRKWALKL